MTYAADGRVCEGQWECGQFLGLCEGEEVATEVCIGGKRAVAATDTTNSENVHSDDSGVRRKRPRLSLPWSELMVIYLLVTLVSIPFTRLQDKRLRKAVACAQAKPDWDWSSVHKLMGGGMSRDRGPEQCKQRWDALQQLEQGSCSTSVQSMLTSSDVEVN